MKNVILVGFMGSGKSAVGRALADRLERPLIDTDALVEARAGRSISEIFESCGEAEFRRLERVAVGEVARLRNVVVATGGGAWADAGNRAVLSDSGPSVYLQTSAEEILRRVAHSGDRPLLRVEDPAARVRELLASRSDDYRRVSISVPTDGREPGKLADEIARRLDLVVAPAVREEVVEVAVDPAYRVLVGCGLRERIGDILGDAGLAPRPAFLGTDRMVEQLYADPWTRAFGDAGYPVRRHVTAGGEEAKSLREAGQILDRLLAGDPDRDTPVLALGGGVVGDLFGFVAAVALRGLPLVALPTTLLAQVDSSVGGKVAVNHPQGKNLIGAFHQPRAVLADIRTLSTLPGDEFRNGMAEVIKHGFLDGGAYLERVAGASPCRGQGDLRFLRDIVAGSCRLKARYVAGDEREAGRRVHLNLGHTAAHAVETLSRGQIAHGEAVGFGLRVALRLSERLGYLASTHRGEMEATLDRWRFATGSDELLEGMDPGALLSAMAADKKRRDGRLRWVLLEGPGRPTVVDDVPETEVLAALKGE